VAVGVRLMGSVGLAIDGRPIDVGGPKPQCILGVLALSAGRPVSTDRIIDLVWDERPPATALRTVQSCAASLRRSMGADPRLRSVQGGYLLDVQRGDVDLLAFEDSMSLLLAERSSGPDERAAALSEALSLWGTPLGGLGTSERFRGLVAPFEELHLQGIEALASSQILGSAPGEAVRTLSALVHEYPTRESLWMLLAKGFARIGRRDAALDAVQHARDELRVQLGVDPSPELLDYERELLVEGVELDASSSRPVSSRRGHGVPAMAGALPTGTVTFMFTDIEESTHLWDEHPEQMDDALRRHDELLRRVIDDAGGRVFATGGDGFGAAFPSAVDAVNAALDVQRAMLAQRWPDSVELRVRVGLHAGEAIERDGDYFGPPVNRAARLMGAAHGGQTVVSALVAEVLSETSRIELIDLGRVYLKGIVGPVHVFGVAAPDVPWVDLPLTSAAPTAGHLPRLRTETVGDYTVLQRQVGGLDSLRIVTFTGSGGVGKTRAAIEIGWRVADEFVDGVRFVDLSAIADAASVPSVVAATLGVARQAGVTLDESIVEWCTDRTVLLIFDNCEHVLDAMARLVSRIVAECATVSILATSREPLGVPGEQVMRIPSLHRRDAVRLFVLRAAAADSSFDSHSADREAIEAICDRVDGIPLAIELAAARTTSLTPTEILDRLDDRFRLLRSSARRGPERHETLRATVSWSYHLLSDVERSVFDRLSVFSGGFDLAAAEAIAAGGDVDRDDVIDLLGALVGKSMITADRTKRETRYRLLETLRQYGEEQLDASGSSASVRDRHLAHYTTLVEQLFAQWESPDQLVARERYGLEWDNVRAAHAWSCATLDVQRSQTLVLNTAAYAQLDLRSEHAQWSTRTLSLVSTPDGLTARVLGNAAGWALVAGRLAECCDLARRGLELAEEPNGRGTCRVMLMYGLMLSGQSEQAASVMPDVQDTIDGDARPFVRWLAARALWDVNADQPSGPAALEQFVSISEQIGGPLYLFNARHVQGEHSLLAGADVDVERAIEFLDEAVDVAGQVGERRIMTNALSLKALAMASGNHPEAADQIRAAITTSIDERAWHATVHALSASVIHLVNQSSFDDAAKVVGFLDTEPLRIDDEYRHLLEGSIASVEASVELTEHRATGRNMSRDDVVAFALDHLSPPA
jgi:predicted ATPase/class 3 adenylate cyclase